MTKDLGGNIERLRGIYLIQGLGLTSNVYVLGLQKPTLIDTGVGSGPNSLIPGLHALRISPKNIAKVIITHAHHDHVGGLFEILEEASPKVYLHPLDAMYIAGYLGPKMVKVEDGDIVETELFPLEVVHTPGHTPGGICLYAREKQILFSGDTVFPSGLYGAYYGESGSLREMVSSLKRLTELKVDSVLAGHDEPLITDGSANIMVSYRKALRRYQSGSQ